MTTQRKRGGSEDNKDEREGVTIHALKRFVRGRSKMASQLASPASTITSRTSDFRQVEERAHLDTDTDSSLPALDYRTIQDWETSNLAFLARPEDFELDE